MKKIQDFIGVSQNITRDSFVIPEDGNGNHGLPCFSQGESGADCLGKGASEKGRSLDKRFSPKVTAILHALFEPFDTFFAHKMLHRQTFDWNFGLEENWNFKYWRECCQALDASGFFVSLAVYDFYVKTVKMTTNKNCANVNYWFAWFTNSQGF